MDHFAPDVTYEGAATGANKIWQCGIMAVRGILGKNPDQLKMAVDGLGTEFEYVTGKDGFYEDGSFVQHRVAPLYRRLRPVDAEPDGRPDRTALRHPVGRAAAVRSDALRVDPQRLRAAGLPRRDDGHDPRPRDFTPGLYRPLGRAQHPRVDAPAERSGPCGGEGAPAGFREGERALGR